MATRTVVEVQREIGAVTSRKRIMSQKYKTFIILIVVCTFVLFGLFLLKRPQPKPVIIGVPVPPEEHQDIATSPNPFATPAPPTPQQPEFWLRIWNKDGTPAQGFPQPEQIYVTSKFKPTVSIKDGIYRIEFLNRPNATEQPQPKKGKRK